MATYEMGPQVAEISCLAGICNCGWWVDIGHSMVDSRVTGVIVPGKHPGEHPENPIGYSGMDLPS
jgi:hypothetical protein